MMFKNTNPRGHGHGRIQVVIDRPYKAKPVIKGTKEVGGKKYYVASDGKEYEQEAFIRNFGKVKLV